MTAIVLFAAGQQMYETYRIPLMQALDNLALDARLVTDAPPECVDYIIYAPSSDVQDFTPYTRCKAVLNLWAGVEKIVGNPTLTQPLCRMVDPSLTQGMVEYVCGHVLRYHLGMDDHIHARPGDWHPVEPPLAQERKVAILGLGALGQAVAQALSTFGFDLHGWARSAKSVPGVRCHHGQDGLKECLSHAQILVTLLPLTAGTENLLDARALALLPKGAALVNPGRGGLVDDAALIAALDSGQVGHATLDVFRTEPLPAEHPFWTHPRVTVTPHIAATTRARTASHVIAQNIARGEQGLPFLHLVDRGRGY
ncbi:2-hydroxyacid dehydrogenase [Roseinatronobacter sp.]